MLILERPWTRQPQTVVGVANRNSLSNGLRLLWSGANPKYSSFGMATVVGGSPGTRVDPGGVSPDFAGAQYIQWNTSPVGSTPAAMTLFVLAKSDAPTTNDQGTALGSTYWAAGSELVRIIQLTTGGWALQSRDSTSANLLQVPSNVTPSSNKHDFVVAVWRPSTGEKVIYVDGVRKNSSTTNTGVINRFSQCEIGFRGAVNTQFFDGSILMAGVYDRALTDAEVASLSGNPWQLFAPRRIPIPTPAAAASAPTITALSARLITATSAQPRITYA